MPDRVGRRLKSHNIRSHKNSHHKLRTKVGDQHDEVDKIVPGELPKEEEKSAKVDKFSCDEYCCKATYTHPDIKAVCDANC